MRRSRLLIGAVCASVAIMLAGCGAGSNSHSANASGMSAADANNNGKYVEEAGVYYQLQVSRELNQYATEDHQYLTGLPAGTAAPTPTQIWYGVFLQALNESKQTRSTTDNFVIVDTQGNKYYPVALNASANAYAWTATQLPPQGTEPAPDTTASFGPIQGSEVLFKLSTTAYNNRPLTLEIRAPGSSTVATISLDL